MGSKVLPLPRPLVSLPTGPPTYSRRQGLSAFSSHFPPTSPHRLAISRAPPCGFGTAVTSQVVRRRRLLAVGSTSGSDEVEAVGDSVGAATEVKEALEGEEPETSDLEAEEKPPRKPRIKLGDIMGILNKRAVEAAEKERPVPDIRTGDVVVIKLEVPENRRRLSVYKGIVMSRQNAGIHTTIRIRRIIAGVGVEIVLPLYSPNIKEIKVVSHRKVRRARLYYLRDKLPRLSTFK